MRIYGWCLTCKKTRLVRVSSALSISTTKIPVGICRDCETKKEKK